MKHSLLILILISVSAISLFGNYLTVKENNDSCLKIQFTNSSLSLKLRDTRSDSDNLSTSENIVRNNYNLPVINTLIQVPANFKPVVKLINPKFETQNNVVYTKIDEDIAVSDNIVMTSAPFVMRNNLLSTLSIQPYTYNSETSTLQILQSADIEIDFVPDNSFSLTSQVKTTKEFKSWLSNTVINYHDLTRNGDADGSLLIIYNQNASALSYIQPLIDWKHQKGWEVHAVSTVTAGFNTTAIKSYIQTAYNTWTNPPEYILMLGKSTNPNSVPTYSEYYNYNTVGDYKYTLLDGTDIIPDAYIGRLTFSSVDQLTTMINKIIAYEKKQGLTNSTWFNQNLLLSDETDSGPSCTTNIDYVRDLIMSYNPTAQNTYVNSGAFPSQITSAINNGVSNYYYRGHNGYSGYTNTDVNNLLNTGRYPFITFITCFSGNFGQQSQLSIGEQFMRVGTASLPKGAIGFIGAVCETHTCLNNIMTGAIAYGFYREGLTNQGQALLRAKLGLLACYPQYPDDYIPQNFQSVNLLGDPSIDIWLKQPTDISVNFAQTVSLPNGSLQVTVTDVSGNPVNLAKVCLLKGNDEIFQVGYTNTNGTYIFQWTTATAGNATLTVTKPNYSTYQGTVAFSGVSNSFAIANPQVFSQLISGTHYTFPVSIVNNQYSALTDVIATFTSSTEFVTVNMGDLSFGNLTLNQTAASAQNVDFTIAENCPQNEELNFSLHIQGMNNSEQINYNLYFQVNEQGPDLTIQTSQMGADNLLTPGETSQFTLTLKNLGTTAATGITAHINCFNPDITIAQSTQSFSNISANQTATNTTPFLISAVQTIYTGTPVTLSVELTYNNGSAQWLNYDILIGNVNQTSMTGPDNYGYICVANGDTHPLAKPYNWVELNPSLSGTGTPITLTDNTLEGSGTFSTINIPFTFKYYGQYYTQITVCSNGFLMPGSQGSQEWMNWAIPGPMVPRPIIAPFWDDLIIQTDSRIFYKYYSASNLFVIEWYKLKNKYNTSSQETFEVVLYGSSASPTPTGDNAILFQYQTFNNVDAGNYGVDYVDHGQYATVGIGDHTGLNGIGYTYQNIYPDTATELTNSSTLFFSTVLTQNTVPNPQVESFQSTETVPVFANDQIDCGETISLTPVIINNGAAILPSSTLFLTCADANVTIISANSTLNSLSPAMSLAVNTPFQIQINTDCPNLSEIDFDLQISSLGSVYYSAFSLVVHAPQISFSSFLVNGSEAFYLSADSPNPVILQLTNLSNLPLNNATFTLQNSSDWTANPNQFNLNILSQGTASLNFNLTTSATTPLGSIITVSGLFNLPGIYDSLFTKQLYVGQLEAIFTQDFDVPGSFQNWNFSPGVEVQPAANIHQTGYEVVISPFQDNTNYALFSPTISAFDSQIIQLSFSYLNDNPNAQSDVFVAYNNSDVWQNIYCFSEIQDSVTLANCVLTNLPNDIQSVRFKWFSTILYYNPGLIVLDDVEVKAIHHPDGFVTGTVSLDNFVQNVTQVRISASTQPDVFVHPDQYGNYSLPLYQGDYPFIKAELEHFLPQIINNVNVTSSQNNADNDFSLPYLRKPVEVTYHLGGNILYLNWQLEPYSDKSPHRIDPDYYRIYLTHNSVTFEDTTSVRNWQHQLETGTYQVYLKSVFHDVNNNECYSDSSDVCDIDYTANNDNHLTPVVFELKQNYPNPFNPKTVISYSLNKSGNTSILIYNLKGETVRTLLNKNLPQGTYNLEFDGLDNNSKSLSSGVYFYKLVSGDKTIIRKMVLLK